MQQLVLLEWLDGIRLFLTWTYVELKSLSSQSCKPYIPVQILRNHYVLYLTKPILVIAKVDYVLHAECAHKISPLPSDYLRLDESQLFFP